MTQPENKWYAAKGLFRWYFKETGETGSVEERVVLILATSDEEAFDKAEEEAKGYCSLDDPTANFAIEPMEWLDLYLVNETPADRIEVYSRLMDTDLSADSFLRRYYPKSQIHKPPAP